MRTTNPVESVFTAVRHRTVRTKGALSRKSAQLMVFKLVMAASKTWRRLKGENRLPKVIAGIKFTDGVAADVMTNQNAAWTASSPKLPHSSNQRLIQTKLKARLLASPPVASVPLRPPAQGLCRAICSAPSPATASPRRPTSRGDGCRPARGHAHQRSRSASAALR